MIFAKLQLARRRNKAIRECFWKNCLVKNLRENQIKLHALSTVFFQLLWLCPTSSTSWLRRAITTSWVNGIWAAEGRISWGVLLARGEIFYAEKVSMLRFRWPIWPHQQQIFNFAAEPNKIGREKVRKPWPYSILTTPESFVNFSKVNGTVLADMIGKYVKLIESRSGLLSSIASIPRWYFKNSIFC